MEAEGVGDFAEGSSRFKHFHFVAFLRTRRAARRKKKEAEGERFAMASWDSLLIGRWQGYAFLTTLRICPHCHFNFDPLEGQREGGA